MAYMNQDKKAVLAPKIKAVLKKYGVKGSIAVHNLTTLVVNIKSGDIDFVDNYNTTGLAKQDDRFKSLTDAYVVVNQYWYNDCFSGKALDFFTELFAAMNDGNHNRSDIQADYFDVGWYVYVNVGAWNKPYIVA